MDKLEIAGKKFDSRLLIGTGKFASPELMQKAVKASGAEIVTVAIRRVDLNNSEDNYLNFLDRNQYLFLPNTSGARNAEEAIKIAKIIKAFDISNWIKLEVTPEPDYLLPDPIETLKATEALVKMGFIVLPYMQADPILAKRLEDVGTAAVMPLAAPIGSNRGNKTRDFVSIIIEQAKVPVIVDAGLGAPSHAAEALELGADAVLVNTAIATAKNPVLCAEAFKLAVEAGRKAYLSGLRSESFLAEGSSPLENLIL